MISKYPKLYSLREIDDSLLHTLTRIIHSDWNKHDVSNIIVVKDATFRRIYKIKNELGTFYLKQYAYNNLKKRIKNLFRPEEAVRSLRVSKSLIDSQIPVAEPISAIVIKKGLFLKESFYLMKECKGTNLQEYLKLNKDKTVVLDKLANLLSNFFSNKFSHGDLNLSNILIDNNLNMSFIDVDNIKKHLFLSWRKVKKNLINFNAHIYAAFDHDNKWTLSHYEREKLFKDFFKKYKPKKNVDRFISLINVLTAKKLIKWKKSHLVIADDALNHAWRRQYFHEK